MRVTVKGFKYHEPKADKLSQLEDIEEELGIDLATLIKALKDGIWVKKSNNYINNYDGWLLSFQEDCFVVGYGGDTYAYYFKDYGVTWALTREELEKTQRRK